MMASSMHIYSIPECLTDEETFEDEDADDDWESDSLSKGKELAQGYTGLKYFSNSRHVSSSCNDINLATMHFSEESYYCKMNINSQVSTSLLDFKRFYRVSDSGTSENDNTDLFTNAASFNKNAEKRISKPYLKIEDCNSYGKSAYEKLLCQSSNKVTVPQRSSITSSHRPCMTLSDDDDAPYETLLPQSTKATTSSQLPGELNAGVIIKNESESRVDTSSKSNSNTQIRLGSEKRQSLSSTEIPCSQPRGRSGSVQWIQNIIHNFDQKCRSFLDLRRPSDIAEEGIRNSNEELETMEHSDEESSKQEHQSTSGVGGGRRFSENVIGKQQQRKFLFSSGFGHLKGLWKDRNHENNKRHDMKDIDQLRTDVCPLFNFPQKTVDEDEMILDALRQAMRKCTVVDPSARPPSSSVYQQLFQIVK